jgi:hypothetical protein
VSVPSKVPSKVGGKPLKAQLDCVFASRTAVFGGRALPTWGESSNSRPRLRAGRHDILPICVVKLRQILTPRSLPTFSGGAASKRTLVRGGCYAFSQLLRASRLHGVTTRGRFGSDSWEGPPPW